MIAMFIFPTLLGVCTADGHFADPYCRLRIGYRHALTVFPACADTISEIATDPVDVGQHGQTVAHKRRAPNRFAQLSVLDQIPFAHLELEISVDGVEMSELSDARRRQ